MLYNMGLLGTVVVVKKDMARRIYAAKCNSRTKNVRMWGKERGAKLVIEIAAPTS